MTRFRNKQYLTHSLHQIMNNFYSLVQGKHHNNQEYYDEFNSMVLSAKESGATIGAHPGAINKILSIQAVDINLVTKQTRATKTAINQYLVVTFLLGAD